MKNIVQYKALLSLLLAGIFLAISVYQFAIGNVSNSHAWFLWGMGAMAAGALWLLVIKIKSKEK